MSTSLPYIETRGDTEQHNIIWLKKVEEAKDDVDESKPGPQKQTAIEALTEVYRQYYDFLQESNQTETAGKLLQDHPEINRREAAAA